MKQINIHEAKTQLSKLIDLSSAGEEIIIAKHGKPVARLVPFKQAIKKRIPGNLAGKVKISHDFDAPLPDDIALPFGMK